MKVGVGLKKTTSLLFRVSRKSEGRSLHGPYEKEMGWGG